MRPSRVVSWPLIALLRTKLTLVQNFGFSGMSSCRTFTLLGMLVPGASALLNFLESRKYSRSRHSRLSSIFCPSICTTLLLSRSPIFN